MKLKRASNIFLIFALFGAATLCANAQNKSILKLADEYSLAFTKYQTQKSGDSIESLLKKGKAVGENISEIESLSETDYALLEKKMKGYVVNRDEILFIKPDLKFFAALAGKRGTKADVAFFALMLQLRPENVWASYLEQQTDYSGCTIYGNGLLTRLYGRALQFKKNFPKDYIVFIKEEINGILEEFPESGCACGNRDSVLREYRLFIKVFPNDRNTPAIRKRLKAIEKRNDFRFNCQSG